MALFDGVETVFYQVCNMEKAVAFYGGTLGLELKRREGNDWAEFTVGGVDIALSGELAVAPSQGGATVVLRTPNMDLLRTHLSEKGVQMGQVEDLGGAKMLDFYDPDGNQVVAMQAEVA